MKLFIEILKCIGIGIAIIVGLCTLLGIAVILIAYPIITGVLVFIGLIWLVYNIRNQ